MDAVATCVLLAAAEKLLGSTLSDRGQHDA